MAPAGQVTAAVLIIGNEILSGRTQDANLAWLAVELNKAGVQLREARVVPDIEAEIVAAVNALRARYDYVFTTGGIGPTHDDITADCVAKAFGQKLILHPEAERILRSRMAQMGVEVTEARLRMARTPEKAELVENPVSGAPGFRVENVFVMAGIPRIMQAMFTSARQYLRGGVTILSRTVGCPLPEGVIADGLTAVQDAFPDVDIGSYPHYVGGKPGTNLVARGPDPLRLDEATVRIKALIVELGGVPTEVVD
ncbi:MAG: competence/damage-inducible protein A [Alphaproteobacteria bacterium]|nr:competence/damage-inducible protein A [Alphaproteobacteria bacterium]